MRGRRCHAVFAAVVIGQAWGCLAPADNFVLSDSVSATDSVMTTSGVGTMDPSEGGSEVEGSRSGGRDASGAGAGAVTGTGPGDEQGETSTELGSGETDASSDQTGALEGSSDGASESGTGDADGSEDSETTSDASTTSATSTTSTTVEGSTLDTDAENETSGESTADSSDTTTGSECVRQLCGAYNPDGAGDDTLIANGLPVANRFHLGTDARQVVGVEVYTGALAGNNRFSIWSDLAGLPSTQLDSVAWRTRTSVGWQGADFSEPVDVAGGSLIWVAWHPNEGARANVAVVGAVAPTMVSADEGLTWADNGVPRAVMVKVYCCEL